MLTNIYYNDILNTYLLMSIKFTKGGEHIMKMQLRTYSYNYSDNNYNYKKSAVSTVRLCFSV